MRWLGKNLNTVATRSFPRCQIGAIFILALAVAVGFQLAVNDPDCDAHHFHACLYPLLAVEVDRLSVSRRQMASMAIKQLLWHYLSLYRNQ